MPAPELRLVPPNPDLTRFYGAEAPIAGCGPFHLIMDVCVLMKTQRFSRVGLLLILETKNANA